MYCFKILFTLRQFTLTMIECFLRLIIFVHFSTINTIFLHLNKMVLKMESMTSFTDF